MDLPKYQLGINSTGTTYEFRSIGEKGDILKIIQFTQISRSPLIYNLGFGDWNDTTQSIDDSVRTDNGDRDKVLATVAYATLDFLSNNPNVQVFAQGSTHSRTRLYQIGINNYLADISNKYKIWGFCNGNWENFTAGTNYEAFMIANK